MKCFFYSYDCCGKNEIKRYEVPLQYWGFPIVYICEYHKDYEVTWIDALNSKSNINTNNAKMTHTKKLSKFQGLESWIGNCDEIFFCQECKGTGEKGDNINSPIPCKACNCTGRMK